MTYLNRFALRRGVPIGLLALLVLAGCSSVQYVSRYDAATEAKITSIQTQVETLLSNIEQSLGAPEAAYSNYTQAYAQLQIDAKLLNTRAQAIDHNRITVEQSEQLIAWLDNLEKLHKTGIASGALLAIPRQQAEQIFVAMLKFELAKKRQLDPAIIGEE